MGIFSKVLGDGVHEALTGQRRSWYYRDLSPDLLGALITRIQQILQKEGIVCPHGERAGIDAVEIRWGATSEMPPNLAPWSGWSDEPMIERIPPRLAVRFVCRHGADAGTFGIDPVVVLRPPR